MSDRSKSNAKIRAAYKSGQAVHEIAERFSCSSKRVYKIADAAGLPRRNDRSSVAPQILADYLAGVPVLVIAEKFRCSTKLVYNIVDAANVPRRGNVQPRKKPERNEAIAAGYRSGVSIPKLAREHGLSKQRIVYLLDRAGVDRRPNTAIVRKPMFELVVARGRGQSNAEIAAELGVTPETVARRCRRICLTTPGAEAVLRLTHEQRAKYRIALDRDRMTHPKALAEARRR